MNKRIAELLDEIEAQSDPGLHLYDLVQELRAELGKPGATWPEGLAEVVAELVSASVWNPNSQTFKSLDRKVSWAVGIWTDRHGPMTDEQRQYMADVLISAVRRAARDAGSDKRKLYSYIQREIANMVNHDRVAEGFKRRRAPQADVSELLSGVGASY